MGKSLLLLWRRFCDTSQKSFTNPLKKSTSFLKVVQHLLPSLEIEDRQFYFLQHLTLPFAIFCLPDKSFVVGWIDDVDEYRVQLDLELAFCILLYSSHLYL